MSSPNPTALHESAVLAACHHPLTNSDDEPQFELHNASVTLPNSDEIVSLLQACEHLPLRITGQLRAASIDDSAAWIASGPPRNVSIELNPVLTFSYGAFDDGSIGLWAAGEAGWYTLRPSKRYKAVYDSMTEAVRILFFIADAYQNPRKSGRGKTATLLPAYTAQELFVKYAVEIMGAAKGYPEAAKKIYRHRVFLRGIMTEGREGVRWEGNPLYEHLCKKFPEDTRRSKSVVGSQATADVMEVAREGDQGKAKTKSKTRQPPHAKQTSLDSSIASTTSGSVKRKPGRPPKNSFSNGTDSVSIATTSKPKPHLAEANSKTKTTSKPTSHLRSTRNNSMPASALVMQDSQPSREESDSDTAFHSRRKSALRLKVNKPTKGPPRRGGKLPLLAANEASEDDDEDEDELSQEGTPPLRHSSAKRKRDENEREPKGAKRKNSHSRKSTTDHHHLPSNLDEGIDIPASPSDPEEEELEDDEDSTTQPFTTLHHLLSPLQQNTWHCVLTACTHKIYGPASSSETQKLIREHYDLHAYDEDERVVMARRMAEPSLPTERLVERVKGFVGWEVGALRGSSGSKMWGSRFPEPVRGKV